jgi:tetratricopeptide (TPR) repeat protein
MRSQQRNRILLLALMLALTASAARSAGAETAAGPGRDLSDAEAGRVFELVFQARPNQALDYLASLESRSTGEPLFHLARARCYQEFVPMDDANHDAARDRSAVSIADLDLCIDTCTRRLENGDENPKLLLYRGWAWMSKAYVRSLTRDLFSAGRDSKKGKKDLDAYLAVNPDDPTAQGLLGAFLYFADTIPGAFKFLSKMLMLPTGDRNEGLENLRAAVQGGGLLATDWKLILYNVYFYFEGRFEEGLTGLQELVQKYPEYGRTAIPLALSRPYAPSIAERNDELVGTTVERMYGAPHREVDWNALYLVQLFRAYGDRYFGPSRVTEARLKSIIHESPRHPDWVSAYARLELGRLYAARGDRDQAVSLFESVAALDGLDHLRKEAEILLKDVEKFRNVFDGPALPDTDDWVRGLYHGTPDSLDAIRGRFAALEQRSVAAKFYVAECDLFSGDFDAALEEFDGVISVDAPAWDQAYQMIASTRIAEIYAARGYYKTAARYQGIALSYYHNEYLVDWVVEGRKRYFERLADGKETSPPTLLTGYSPARREAAAASTARPGGGSR